MAFAALPSFSPGYLQGYIPGEGPSILEKAAANVVSDVAGKQINDFIDNLYMTDEERLQQELIDSQLLTEAARQDQMYAQSEMNAILAENDTRKTDADVQKTQADLYRQIMEDEEKAQQAWEDDVIWNKDIDESQERKAQIRYSNSMADRNEADAAASRYATGTTAKNTWEMSKDLPTGMSYAQMRYAEETGKAPDYTSPESVAKLDAYYNEYVTQGKANEDEVTGEKSKDGRVLDVIKKVPALTSIPLKVKGRVYNELLGEQTEEGTRPLADWIKSLFGEDEEPTSAEIIDELRRTESVK